MRKQAIPYALPVPPDGQDYISREKNYSRGATAWSAKAFVIASINHTVVQLMCEYDDEDSHGKDMWTITVVKNNVPIPAEAEVFIDTFYVNGFPFHAYRSASAH